MNLKRRKDILTYGAMLLIGFAFYLLPGKWISVESDTIAYLSPDGREGVLPGYPVFLAFWKMILGEQYFLHGVVISQSLLAVICTFLFVLVLKKQFKLCGLESIFLYILCMLPFSIYLPEVGITHQIMTEGITYAIFYLFFIAVMKAIWTLKYRWYCISMIIAILLGVIRSQMLFLQMVCLLVLIWVSVIRFGKKSVFKVGMGFFALAIFIVIGNWSKIPNFTSQFNTVLMSRGFYEADEEDEELFDDEMMKYIFRKTYQLADEDKHRYEYAKAGLYMWEDMVYDEMKMYAIQAICEYDDEYPGERNMEWAEICRVLGGRVLLKHFDRYLYHSIRLMLPSFIASVFFQIKPIYLLCHFIAFLLYAISICMCFIIHRRNGERKVIELMATILCIMIIMVVTVNILFIGLQRYVVYGMGIFYCSAYLLVRELYLTNRKMKSE